jgi:hypothetical protein
MALDKLEWLRRVDGSAESYSTRDKSSDRRRAAGSAIDLPYDPEYEPLLLSAAGDFLESFGESAVRLIAGSIRFQQKSNPLRIKQ